MQLSDIPPFVVLPFAESGARNTIPVTTATPGAASLTDGFPPETMQPISAGGIPPDGMDMNGILYEVSGWSRWAGAGQPVTHDSTFATAVGGYPRGALLTAASGYGRWYSLAENNTSDPDSGGAGWMNAMPLVTAISTTGSLTVLQQGVVGVNATSGNITLTLPAASAAGGLPIVFSLVRLDASGNTVTVARAGSDTIEGYAGITLPIGARITIVSDGVSSWGIVSRVVPPSMQVFTSSGTFMVPGYVNRVRVIVTGGGGAGGGGNGAAGGGQAGATAIGWYSIAPGTSVAVTIGAGGIGVVGDGGGGGTSSFGAYASAPGGAGGENTSGAGGSSGSNATGGQINTRGGQGGDGTSSSASGMMGGAGGASYWGGGGRMGAFAGGGGLAGVAPGSGGGGAYAASGSGTAPGGNGAAGIVVVEWW